MATTGKNIALILIGLCVLVGGVLNVAAWVTEIENEALRSELVRTGKLENIYSHFRNDRIPLVYDRWKLDFWCPEEYAVTHDLPEDSIYLFVLKGEAGEVMVMMECDSNTIYQDAAVWEERFDLKGERFVFSLESGKEIEALRLLVARKRENRVMVVSSYFFIANNKFFCLRVWQSEDHFSENFRLGEQLFTCVKVRE